MKPYYNKGTISFYYVERDGFLKFRSLANAEEFFGKKARKVEFLICYDPWIGAKYEAFFDGVDRTVYLENK